MTAQICSNLLQAHGTDRLRLSSRKGKEVKPALAGALAPSFLTLQGILTTVFQFAPSKSPILGSVFPRTGSAKVWGWLLRDPAQGMKPAKCTVECLHLEV